MPGKRGQTIFEYAVLIGVTVAALIAMQTYMKRAMQGRLRQSAEQLSEGGFYSPKATTSLSVIRTSSLETSEAIDKTTTSDATSVIETNKSEEILPLAKEPKR
jgi:Flp pilus assembly pilin Flp